MVLFGFLVCKQLNDGRLAVIGIGYNPTLANIESITTSLNIPFISIKWNANQETEPNQSKSSKEEDSDENDFELDDLDDLDKSDTFPIKSVNMHSPSSKVMNAIMDFIDHAKWSFVTIIYQESLGLEHIHHIIRTASITHKMMRLQVRQLSSNIDDWIYLLKDIKLSGSSHIVVDIETRYLNEFIQIVN